jgi:uncharacterized membrane protein
MAKTKRLLDEYRFPGFHPKAAIKGIFGEPWARVIKLERRQKKRFAVVVGRSIGVFTIKRSGWSGICPAGESKFTWRCRYGGLCAASAGK